MIWNQHSNLTGKHAKLSPSQYYWINDQPEQFYQRTMNSYAAEIGTALHDVARKFIKHHFKMSRNDKKAVVLDLIDSGIPDRVIDYMDFDVIFANLIAFVNDANSYGMSPEVVLYYSDNCFGTTDAIGYHEFDRFLRVHDLKTGVTKPSIEQLMIYAALFCLEYRIKPEDLKGTELRIYKNTEVLVHQPTAEELNVYISNIKERDRQLDEIKGREVLLR